jgi:hypothetical protein
MDRTVLDRATPGDLDDAIGQVHAAHCSALGTLLELIPVYDRKEAWRADGATSMADWLTYRLAISHPTARDWVRVALALEELPCLRAALTDGQLSFDQVRWLVRFATPDNDERIATHARGWSVAQCERFARDVRSNTAAHEDFEQRYLRLRRSHDERFLHISGRLPITDGAVLEAAIDREASDAGPDPSTGLFAPYEQRAADALVELASTRLGADATPDRATVVVHTDAATLASDDGPAHLDDGTPVAAEVVRRLLCDGRLRIAAHDGKQLTLGRTRRTAPPWLLTQLKQRDGACTFPGCPRRRWLHAHHIKHWAHGGRTDADNLVMLCGHHHHLVHEGGWRIFHRPAKGLRYVRPDGRPLSTRPPGLRPQIRERLWAREPELADTS